MVSRQHASCCNKYWIILAKCSDNCSTCLLQCNRPSFGHGLMVKPGGLSIFSCPIFIQFLFYKLQIIFHIYCSPCTKLDNFVEEKRLQHQIICIQEIFYSIITHSNKSHRILQYYIYLKIQK